MKIKLKGRFIAGLLTVITATTVMSPVTVFAQSKPWMVLFGEI